MELPFNIIDILRTIEAEPGFLVAFAAFHPFAIMVLAIPLWIFRKMGVYKPAEELGMFGFSVVVIFMLGWLLGFVSQILMMFMGIPGLKMLMIYLSMYLCITAFVIVNAYGMKKWYERDQLKKKPVT
ncbi:hypothetical protein NG800_016885 [Epilithonimonas ginsengisoli]|uniref:DUF4870 domain-containing protein n=1 Tax=Epilithonimonas ginsengisoli TaxID=1245592 RepID=A0ABU4JM93_9FLAO|nr:MULTISPECIES: hypothetical protein [Chryseobacterium group]MBV6881627.1 hypothetical protein [Epilithonimonas sp. FP105]MDW8550606.1 hypothetical protein [Epilithonimonas ginsengisoli]OAH73783.1 hypothetical protein AXA65_07080 [Chryseobacterium sp. FP211-J200]